ncbi:hypothetical protein LC593_34100 [Nostoc sp. CHAB 5844]|nr:hypothetical protein [Nostoc sp. CHAB 5844]
MKQSSVAALMQAYNILQQAVAVLYAQSQIAVELGDDDDASLLDAKADRLFEEADSILVLISEQQEDG